MLVCRYNNSVVFESYEWDAVWKRIDQQMTPNVETKLHTPCYTCLERNIHVMG